MGVILPLPVENTEQVASEIATWQRPPRKYDDRTDKPWVSRVSSLEVNQSMIY
jgi:hypothetical protein